MHAAVLTASGGLALAAMIAGGAGADQIENIIDQTSQAEFKSYLRVLTGVDPVPGDPPYYLSNRWSFGDDIHIAGQWILEQFESFGLDASLAR